MILRFEYFQHSMNNNYFIPDEEGLNLSKYLCFDLFKIVIRIYEENNLSCLLDVEGVLGSRCHQGFIHWKNDSKICFPWPYHQNSTHANSSFLGPYDIIEPFVNVDGDMYLEMNEFNKFVDGIIDSENLIAYFSTSKIAKECKYVYQELEDKLPINGIELECYEIDIQKDSEVLQQKLNN